MSYFDSYLHETKKQPKSVTHRGLATTANSQSDKPFHLKLVKNTREYVISVLAKRNFYSIKDFMQSGEHMNDMLNETAPNLYKKSKAYRMRKM